MKKREYFQRGSVSTFAFTSQVLSEENWTPDTIPGSPAETDTHSQAHPASQDALRLPQHSFSRRGRGRPKQRPEEVVADKAYDSRRFGELLRSKGIRPTIPPYERRARKRPSWGVR